MKVATIVGTRPEIIRLSRVMAGVHYPTDVIGGVASGLIASWLVWHQSHWLSDKLDD